MEQVTLGRTGLSVSRLGFGGAPAGLPNYLGHYRPEDPQARARVIDAVAHAAASGITYFDTAAGYGDGTSESIFGEALTGAGDRIVVATKVGLWTSDVRRGVEESLKRLRRDRLDLIQLHGTSYTDAQADAVLAPGGVLDQLESLRDAGLVRYIGFTTEDTNPPVYRFIRSGRFDVMQVAYNVIYQHPYEPTRPFGCMLEADRKRMGIVTMRSATSGILQRWIQTVNPANTFDYTPACVQFVLSNPLVDVALVGMRSRDEVDRNIALASDTAARIDLKALHERYV